LDTYTGRDSDKSKAFVLQFAGEDGRQAIECGLGDTVAMVRRDHESLGVCN
jgi:hypothetical protein